MTNMIPELEKLLDYLSEHADPNRMREGRERFRQSLAWEKVDRPPLVVSGPLPEGFPFRPFPLSEIFDSASKMLHNELLHAFDLSIASSHLLDHDLPWSVRANFGTVLVASIHGAKAEQVEENPPWIRHGPEHDLSLDQILETDPENMEAGWMPRVRERMEEYHSLLSGYPELLEHIVITLPDLQGPFDNFDHIRGNGAFTDPMDDPEKTFEAMRRVSRTQVAAARYLQPWVKEGIEGFSHQHGFMLKGNILLRCDSVIMLSAAMYREFIAPHDNWVMEEMNGGAIHSCGKIDHLVDEYLKLPGLLALDLGQSELNDRGALYAKAAEKQVPLIRLHTTRGEWESGEFQRNYPTGIAAICRGWD